MTDSNEKQRRRALRDAFKEAERAADRAAMCLSREKLTALIEHVDRAVREKGCDHSLDNTLAWAEREDVDPEVLAESLEHFGGYCDCEVVLNVSVEEIFREPRRGGSGEA